MTEQTPLFKLTLIAQLKKLLFKEENKDQTLKEAYSKDNALLLNECTKSIQKKEANFSQQAISENSDRQISSPETMNNQNVESNKKIQNVDSQIPNIEIDVLILINNPPLVHYVKKTFEKLGVRFFHNLQDLKFENPTIVVKISAARNLDDKLEAAIQNKKPKKSVTMILLSQGSVPVSDKQIMVPNTQTKIDVYAFLYNDQLNKPPFRREEAKGIFKISDVFELIRYNA